MPVTEPRVDAYIAKAAPFARPILEHLREVVHAACPDCVEAIKWSMPNFLFRGRILCGMAAFKKHATFGFWAGSEVVAGDGKDGAMGQFGCLTAASDLPSRKILAGYVKEAMRRAEERAKAPPKQRAPIRAPLPVPDDLAEVLATTPAARMTFDGFAPSQRHAYIEWLTAAKRPETRAKRLAQTSAQLIEGKTRHWKYDDC